MKLFYDMRDKVVKLLSIKKSRSKKNNRGGILLYSRVINGCDSCVTLFGLTPTQLSVFLAHHQQTLQPQCVGSSGRRPSLSANDRGLFVLYNLRNVQTCMNLESYLACQRPLQPMLC